MPAKGRLSGFITGRLSILTAILVVCAFSHVWSDDAPKPPGASRIAVPGTTAQGNAEGKVRDAFGNHDKAAAEERAQTAAKMLEAADSMRDDPATFYVLLKKCGDLAAGGGDAETALKAASMLGDAFIVDPDELSAQWLRKCASGSLSPPAATKFVEASIAFAKKAAANEKFDLAIRALAPAETAAKNADDPSLRNRLRTSEADLRALQTESTRVKSAQAKLVKNPDDPDANYIVGRFQCLGLDDWAAGLPVIAKGANPGFHLAAATDLANPTTSAEQVAAGDVWWNLSEKETGRSKSALQRRALVWYTKAQLDPKLNALSRIKIQKRAESASAVASDASPAAGLDLTGAGHPRNKTVVYFPGTGREEAVFRQISNDEMRAFARPESTNLLADSNGLANVGILVFGNEFLRDTPPNALTPKVESNLRKYVGDGGDLVVFEQQSGDTSELLDKLFKVKVTVMDCHRLVAVPKELAVAVERAGLVDDAHRNSFNSCNLYTTPPNAVVFYRGGEGAMPTLSSPRAWLTEEVA